MEQKAKIDNKPSVVSHIKQPIKERIIKFREWIVNHKIASLFSIIIVSGVIECYLGIAKELFNTNSTIDLSTFHGYIDGVPSIWAVVFVIVFCLSFLAILKIIKLKSIPQV